MKFMISDHFDTWQSAPFSSSRHEDMDSAAEQAFSISHSDTAAAPTWHCFELQYSHEYYDGVLSSAAVANVVIVTRFSQVVVVVVQSRSRFMRNLTAVTR